MRVSAEMSVEDFEGCVPDALDQVPPLALMDNVVVMVEAEPPTDEPSDLLGLYVGTPLTERDAGWFGSLPDRISIFRGPTLRMCADRAEVVEEVTVTVVHEIAHHFRHRRRPAARPGLVLTWPSSLNGSRSALALPT